MSEEVESTNDGTWSGLKKTIIGVATTLVTAGGVWVSTLLGGGDKTEPAPQQAAPVQQAQPVATPDAIPEPTVRPASAPVQAAPTKVDLGDPSLDDLLGEWS